MLRERVLRSWKDCKEKVINFKKGVSVLSKSINFLPTFPIGVQNCRSKLELWNSYEYQEKLKKAKHIGQEVMLDALIDLSISCSSSFDMFKELVQGWKKEMDNNSQSGPTLVNLD